MRIYARSTPTGLALLGSFAGVIIHSARGLQQRFQADKVRPEKLLLKPPYAAPELALGQAMSPWTDLDVLGIVSFELPTGRRPYNWQSLEDIRNLHHAGLPSVPLELGCRS
jgi:serine/threonine protein kinase